VGDLVAGLVAAAVLAAGVVGGATVREALVRGAGSWVVVGAAAEGAPERAEVEVVVPQADAASASVTVRPSASVREPYIGFPQVVVCMQQRRRSCSRYTSLWVRSPLLDHL
jgi:hypothetical protein